MNPVHRPYKTSKLRFANIALQLFQGGKDTSEIAKSLNRPESEVVELIRFARGKVPEG
jgi:hypothetical protein